MDREQTLALPQWEYEMYYSGIHAIEARQQLSMVNATSVGFGGLDKRDKDHFFKTLSDLRDMGLNKPKKVVTRKKGKEFSDLIAFIG